MHKMVHPTDFWKYLIQVLKFRNDKIVRRIYTQFIVIKANLSLMKSDLIILNIAVESKKLAIFGIRTDLHFRLKSLFELDLTNLKIIMYNPKIL